MAGYLKIYASTKIMYLHIETQEYIEISYRKLN